MSLRNQVKLKSLLRKFYDHHHGLVNRYGVFVSTKRSKKKRKSYHADVRAVIYIHWYYSVLFSVNDMYGTMYTMNDDSDVREANSFLLTPTIIKG